jgi:2,3-bisphosphoglycerate-independent phosphoglycerate mutase
LKSDINRPGVKIYPGVAYRHLFVWDKGPEQSETIPPHDVLEKNMAVYLNGSGKDPIPEVIKSSWPILKNHPVNMERKKKGLNEANSIWLWGQGRSPRIPLFRDKFDLRGGVISAVDLLKGIGVYAGFQSIYVEGATGYIDTNYEGKARAAIEGLAELDFVFLHVEAPDEAGHAGDYKQKIEAIENFDEKVVGKVLEGLNRFNEYRIMVVSDHFTPIVKRTHTNDPTPFAWAEKKEIESANAGPSFTEKAAKESGLFLKNGHDLTPSFIGTP